MSQKNWKEILKELENANPLNDSLELGDSWRGLPRRTEGVANKTNGLYRRSGLPAVDRKNLYNFIIEKPTVNNKTKSNSANEAVASQPQKTMSPIAKPISCGDADDNDSFNFTQFLNGKNNDLKAITSTPYPNRHTDKSPKRPAPDVLRRAADSPKKNFLLVPTRIPVSTPRSSRKPDESEQRAPHKRSSESNANKMSSPIVSSTVDCSDDGDGDIEFDREKSPEQQALPSLSRTSPETGNADQNCVPFDKDQQEQDACEKPSDEALFRRPQMVRQPSQKQKQLESKNEQPADQSESSNNSQRNKKTKKVDILLDNYMKVGESLINKTNTVQSESSTSSLSRRKLYRKGDSCNENEIDNLNAPAPVDQQCVEPVPSNETHSIQMQAAVRSDVGNSEIQMGPTASNRSVRVADVFPKTSIDCLPEATLQEKLLVSQLENVIDLTDCDVDQPETQVESASNNEAKKSLNDEPSQLSPSIEEDGDANGHSRKSNSVDQLNPMSVKHSDKQVLEQILQDWPDANDKQNDNEEGRSDASDSEQPIRHEIEKQPPKELIVRQVRSKNQKNPKVDMPSAKNTQVRQTRANMRNVNENLASEDDEKTLTKMSKPLRANEGSVVTSAVKKTEKMQKKGVSKKSKTVPVDSNQDHENIEDNLTDSKEPIVAEPAETTRSLRTKKEKVNYVQNIEPWKKSRPKKRRIDLDADEVKVPTKSQVKAKKIRLNVEEDATNEIGESDDIEDELPTESEVTGKNKRLNVEKDEDENDGSEVNFPTKSQKKTKSKPVNVEENGNQVKLSIKTQKNAKKKPVNVEKDVTERNGETDGNGEEMSTKSRVKPKKKTANVEKDATERNGETDGNGEEMSTKSRVKPKKKTANVEKDATERNGETDGNGEEMSTKSRVKPKKKPVNVEKDETERGETDGNGEEMSTKSRVTQKKKPVNVEKDATETADVGDATEFDDNPAQNQTDGNANKTLLSTKPKSRQPRKRKQPANDDGGTRMSRSNASVARKRKYVTKWEVLHHIDTYDSMKPREIAPGLRHSSRERRKPEHNFPLLVTLPKTTTIVGSALRSKDSNVAPPKRRRIQSNESENLYSMLLNGTNDQEPPLISRLRGIEIAQGFHKTVKNNLVIHHVPGETGPSYGYFTLKPGMIKPSCRISWNLHIQIVSGPVTIISENESETMKTGSFASLHSGTKYSLRNDGENSALVFFSQHWPDNSVNES